MATFKGDKLVGKTNYIEWYNNATLFLEINGYMPYIDGTELSPNKSLYYKTNTDGIITDRPYSPELAVKYIEKELEFQRNNKRALGAIKSTISIENIDRFKDKTNASSLWKAIISTYGESSLELISRYLNKIIDAKYSYFNSIDEYTSQIQSSALYLKDLGYELPKPIIASLIFKGLPSSFDAIASRKYEELAKDIANIDISKLISELISEEARMSSISDLEANKAIKPNKRFCIYCNKKGHIEPKCFLKYPELRTSYNNKTSNKSYNSNRDKEDNYKVESSKAIMSAFIANKNRNKFDNKLVLDSGATEHYTPIKRWLIDYKIVKNKTIIIANGTRVPIKGIGNIPIKIGNKDVLITNVYYIPCLNKTLISSKELTKKGWTILFKDNIAELSNNKFKLNLKAIWDYNAYYLNAKIDHNKLLDFNKRINNKLDNKTSTSPISLNSNSYIEEKPDLEGELVDKLKSNFKTSIKMPSGLLASYTSNKSTKNKTKNILKNNIKNKEVETIGLKNNKILVPYTSNNIKPDLIKATNNSINELNKGDKKLDYKISNLIYILILNLKSILECQSVFITFIILFGKLGIINLKTDNSIFIKSLILAFILSILL